MKRAAIPLVLISAAFASAAQAQQGSVTILRGESNSGAPDTGVRRVSPGTPAPAVRPSGPARGTAQPIATGQGIVPAQPSDVAQALADAKPLSDAEAAALGAALKAIDESRWADARATVANFGQPLLVRIVDWNILRAAPRTEADFASIWRFLRENPDWPEPEVLRRQAEDRIGADTPANEAFRYFTAFPPLTSSGLIRRMDAAQAASPKDVPRLARESWRNGTFRDSDETDFLNRYGHHLTGEDDIGRFDRILRQGRTHVASALLSRLPPDYQPVARARLAMATRATDTVNILRGVPAAKLNEPAMRLERVSWLRRTGNLEEAKSILVAPTPNPSGQWWTERQQVARELLAAGRAADAYAVVAPHGYTRGLAFAEAEFLAGWIVLRHLKKPTEGLKHFQRLYDGVSTDISKSRAAYWLARTHESAGRSKEAKDWYTRAAGFGQTFYGQLAARKLPGGAARLPSDPVASDGDRQALSTRELVVVARYLGQAGDYERTRPFLLRLARMVEGPGQTLLLAQLAAELRRPDISVGIARRGVENGVTLFDASFPVVDIGATGSIERALALALTRQESQFDAAAVSSSGALGLMQLLPGTARDVAGRLGMPFIREKLTRDPAYNVQLGSQYLAEMLQRFGGSYEIALAAYNAGPNRVARWLETMGDPRSGKIDMVDWIEMIPFGETRNYVQRVMEGVGVYRDRLNGPFRTVPPATGPS